MTGKTHLACGMFVGALSIQYFKEDIFVSTTIMTLAALSSLLPDICHASSKVGRKFKLLSFVIRTVFGHRTFTHSLLFMGIIYVLLNFIHTPNYYVFPIIGGICSHIILDMLTKRGVKLLYPIPISVKFPFQFKTGGTVDLSLASTFSAVTLYIFFKDYIHQYLNIQHIFFS
ncbi:metal-dependent hydrolase [Staphylococcus massiliensis]|uniref:Membrane-bound metal-dependent hydrolase n=1 Tax=Staphylococcus massiliensis S46 TaxID=1229783 RepID=K9ATB1_9STAP|nr:metal-dependent hydrolase [Staphylococcus massiliensis]EKU45837.1 hypothetical protein C273_10617 [Staphylococcus massiliensis S46]MCG3399322.1 metal-dependent hydrolase [Staphylococcus massiliensis]MCG3402576.1 metal-dependent hydrolase [Staphylococcus massiliensis]MCG3413325.1 metal-dependent hydrolase [Staphylococcus massiliensis]POA00662.1 metal-dependent hydrolase [Staphylococcus massiliensis CCUG 55927]